ncbi:hypothetical protein N7452_001680 [Penicillium brevicompactum]|uniref:Uncharacterized protein n=1 Tax=Penicillium brevicompactum TaxID=5074 RepID=A0A9W9US20_PENBR|nr:hypothetical protein N7452_001680 [Penicillium brevicompactum]
MTYREVIEVPDVFRILTCWACLDSQDVWFELLDPSGLVWPGVQRMKYDFAMGKLSDYGIIESRFHSGKKSLGSPGHDMQRSFHAWMRNRILDSTRDLSVRPPAFSAVFHSFQNLLRTPACYEGLLRVLPHASQCAHLVKDDRVYTDENNLIHLAKVFQHAGHGRSFRLSLFLSMLQFKNPAKAHLLTSEKLLQHALRKIDEAPSNGPDEESAGNSSTQRSLYRSKLMALYDLRSLYTLMSEYSKRQGVTVQLYALHRAQNNETEAQLEQRNVNRDIKHATQIRLFTRVVYIGAAFTFLEITLCILFLKDGMDLLQFLIAPYCFMGSWCVFMNGGRHRWKAFVVLVLATVAMGYQFRNLDIFILVLVGYQFVLMLLATLPSLYYQIRHGGTH